MKSKKSVQLIFLISILVIIIGCDLDTGLKSKDLVPVKKDTTYQQRDQPLLLEKRDDLNLECNSNDECDGGTPYCELPGETNAYTITIKT